MLTAARELALGAADAGLTTEHILPTMDERHVFPRVAAAVAVKAVELGIARTKKSREEFLQRAKELMERPVKLVEALAAHHLTAPMPDEPSGSQDPR